MHTQVLILGSGPAGYSAGLYTSLAGLDTVLLTGKNIGGQLTLTNEIENYPGFLIGKGIELMDIFQKQIIQSGVRILYEQAIHTDLKQKPFYTRTDTGTEITADTIIIATGNSARWLNLPTEKQFIGRGISICATCDGFFYKNKIVSVIGGGNTAGYEALYLAQTAQVVYLIYRENTFQAEKNITKKINKNPKIQQIANHTVLSFSGKDKLEKITIQHTQTKKTQDIYTSGVFEAIGHIPNSQLFQGQLDIDSDGYIITDSKTFQTSCQGIFACGDIQSFPYRQAIIAAGTGCIAALSAKKYLLATLKN